MRYRFTILFLLLCAGHRLSAQYPSFSIGTDLGVIRNWPKGQQFTGLNHSLLLDFHLAPKEGVQINFSYCNYGKYTNLLFAKADDPATVPQQIRYSNEGKLRFRLLSIGWKHYLVGHPQVEKGWNLYTKAGFGLLMGRVENKHDRILDTALYQLPVLQGNAPFKRMTFDLALGWEKPLGGDFYFYTEVRVSVPSPGYPSPYLLVNDNAPFPAVFCGGLRILF